MRIIPTAKPIINVYAADVCCAMNVMTRNAEYAYTRTADPWKVLIRPMMIAVKDGRPIPVEGSLA
ncbi:hypothetical protein B9G55_04920 [Saccharibacillus sp. O16]|nr:hypothetical protein B9G55_04920 [Saccharibacillus sp. O16]